MWAAIARGFRSVLRFSGRDTPGQFWPYAIFLFVTTQAVAASVMMPLMMRTTERVREFAATHPDKVTMRSSPGQVSIEFREVPPGLLREFTAFFHGVAVVALIVVLLMTAAVARRLHDRNLSSLWGLMPLPFLVGGLVMMPAVMASATPHNAPDMRLFFALFANNLTYLATLGLLIVLLVGKSSEGENRFGPPSGGV